MKYFRLLTILVAIAIMSGCASSLAADWSRGHAAYVQKRYPEAIKYFKKAVAIEPMDGRNHWWLLLAYYYNGQYQEAIESGKRVIELKADMSGGNTWNLLALSYNELSQMEPAIQAIKKAIEINPTEPVYFANLSSFYNQNGQYDDAITAAKRVIELKPDYAIAYNNIGVACGKKKQYREAFKSLKRAVEIDPKFVTAYANMGNFYTEIFEYEKAAQVYSQATELEPKNGDYYFNISFCYYCMGKYDDALSAVNRYVNLNTFTGIGITFEIENGLPVVKTVLKRAPAEKVDIRVGDKIIKIDGKPTKDWDNAKVTEHLRGEAGTGVKLLITKADDKEPLEKIVTRELITNANCGLRSLIQRGKGAIEEALNDSQQAFDLYPSNRWAQYSAGAAYFDKGQYDQAIQILVQVKDIAEAKIMLATAYAKQGKTKEAIDTYMNIPAEELSPKNVPLWNGRAALLATLAPVLKSHREKAGKLESQGRFQDALSELSRALLIAEDNEAKEIMAALFQIARKIPPELPEEAHKHHVRAKISLEEGNFENAVSELKQALQLAPYSARLYFDTALICAELKNYREAISYMKIYIQAAPDASDVRASKDEIIKWELLMEKEK